jgi:threonine dehydrogenase-like Zn-dependent dehydrogenase
VQLACNASTVRAGNTTWAVATILSAVKPKTVNDRILIPKHLPYHPARQLCPDVIFAATPPFTLGTLCRYYKLPHELVYTLPDTCTLEDGAMIEPLAVGVHSVAKLGNFQTGQNIAVFGAGPVGLLCMAVAKALGAKRILAVGQSDDVLSFGRMGSEI